MLRTFNCGIGLVMIVGENEKSLVLQLEGSRLIGEVQSRKQGEPQVEVVNFDSAFTPLMKPFVGDVVKLSSNIKKIGVLITENEKNLQSIIDNIKSGDIDGEIVLVVSNLEGVCGLERAKNAGIPAVVIRHALHVCRRDFEEQVHKQLLNANVEVVVLAGFMRILTNWFVSKWRGKLINVHPTLLPSFKGTNSCQQALNAGVRVSGCTVHFVEEEVDAGAIIVQEVVQVETGETVESLKKKASKAEQRALPKAVQLICSEKCSLDLKTGKAIWA